MYDTPERVRRVEKRLLEGQRRKRRRSVYRLGALCAGVCALLVGVLSAVTKRQPVSASGTFGAMQVHAGAGGYVLPYADSPLDDERVGECVYLDILNHAERYVRIFTPYLILDETMVTALTFAAKRGVDVELILPHVPDKKFAFALAKGHYRELLDAGVKIYEYTPGFVHAKVFVSDDRKAVVGTINLDYRSLYLHFEDAVYLYDCPCIKDIVADFDATRAQSQIVTHGDLARIPLHTRIAAALLKLVAPLM